MSKAIAVNSEAAIKIATALETYEAEYAKFQSGTKIAAARARKALQEIRKVAADQRFTITDEKNGKAAA